MTSEKSAYPVPEDINEDGNPVENMNIPEQKDLARVEVHYLTTSDIFSHEDERSEAIATGEEEKAHELESTNEVTDPSTGMPALEEVKDESEVPESEIENNIAEQIKPPNDVDEVEEADLGTEKPVHEEQMVDASSLQNEHGKHLILLQTKLLAEKHDVSISEPTPTEEIVHSVHEVEPVESSVETHDATEIQAEAPQSADVSKSVREPEEQESVPVNEKEKVEDKGPADVKEQVLQHSSYEESEGNVEPGVSKSSDMDEEPSVPVDETTEHPVGEPAKQHIEEIDPAELTVDDQVETHPEHIGEDEQHEPVENVEGSVVEEHADEPVLESKETDHVEETEPSVSKTTIESSLDDLGANLEHTEDDNQEPVETNLEKSVVEEVAHEPAQKYIDEPHVEEVDPVPTVESPVDDLGNAHHEATEEDHAQEPVEANLENSAVEEVAHEPVQESIDEPHVDHIEPIESTVDDVAETHREHMEEDNTQEDADKPVHEPLKEESFGEVEQLEKPTIATTSDEPDEMHLGHTEDDEVQHSVEENVEKSVDEESPLEPLPESAQTTVQESDPLVDNPVDETTEPAEENVQEPTNDGIEKPEEILEPETVEATEQHPLELSKEVAVDENMEEEHEQAVVEPDSTPEPMKDEPATQQETFNPIDDLEEIPNAPVVEAFEEQPVTEPTPPDEISRQHTDETSADKLTKEEGKIQVERETIEQHAATDIPADELSEETAEREPTHSDVLAEDEPGETVIQPPVESNELDTHIDSVPYEATPTEQTPVTEHHGEELTFEKKDEEPTLIEEPQHLDETHKPALQTDEAVALPETTPMEGTSVTEPSGEHATMDSKDSTTVNETSHDDEASEVSVAEPVVHMEPNQVSNEGGVPDESAQHVEAEEPSVAGSVETVVPEVAIASELGVENASNQEELQVGAEEATPEFGESVATAEVGNDLDSDKSERMKEEMGSVKVSDERRGDQDRSKDEDTQTEEANEIQAVPEPESTIDEVPTNDPTEDETPKSTVDVEEIPAVATVVDNSAEDDSAAPSSVEAAPASEDHVKEIKHNETTADDIPVDEGVSEVIPTEPIGMDEPTIVPTKETSATEAQSHVEHDNIAAAVIPVGVALLGGAILTAPLIHHSDVKDSVLDEAPKEEVVTQPLHEGVASETMAGARMEQDEEPEKPSPEDDIDGEPQSGVSVEHQTGTSHEILAEPEADDIDKNVAKGSNVDDLADATVALEEEEPVLDHPVEHKLEIAANDMPEVAEKEAEQMPEHPESSESAFPEVVTSTAPEIVEEGSREIKEADDLKSKDFEDEPSGVTTERMGEDLQVPADGSFPEIPSL